MENLAYSGIDFGSDWSNFDSFDLGGINSDNISSAVFSAFDSFKDPQNGWIDNITESFNIDNIPMIFDTDLNEKIIDFSALDDFGSDSLFDMAAENYMDSFDDSFLILSKDFDAGDIWDTDFNISPYNFESSESIESKNQEPAWYEKTWEAFKNADPKTQVMVGSLLLGAGTGVANWLENSDRQKSAESMASERNKLYASEGEKDRALKESEAQKAREAAAKLQADRIAQEKEAQKELKMLKIGEYESPFEGMDVVLDNRGNVIKVVKTKV